MNEFEIEAILRSQEFASKYNKAIELLYEIHFDKILSYLNKPAEIDGSHPQAIQKAALDQAKLAGWRECSEVVFNMLLDQSEIAKIKENLDYGAREKLRSLGYSEAEIEDAIKEDE